MLDLILDKLIIPNYKKPGWKQAKWTMAVIALPAIIPIIGIFSLLFSINPNNPIEKQGTPAIVWLLAVFILPFMMRLVLWHLFIKRLAKDSNRPQRPKQPKDGQIIPAHQLSPSALENEIAWVFETLRPAFKAEITGGIGDEGIDVRMYDATGMLKGIIQVKRLQPDAFCKPTHLRDLDSCRRRLGVESALLATTGKFSQKTRKQAEEWRLSLWDGAIVEEYRQRAYARVRVEEKRAVQSSPSRAG